MSTCTLISTMHAFACHAAGGVTVFIRLVVVHGAIRLRVLGMTA